MSLIKWKKENGTQRKATCKVATFLGNINESMQKTLNAKDREIFDDKKQFSTRSKQNIFDI